MRKQTNTTLLAGILLILLFSACGPLETAPVSVETSEPIVAITEIPAGAPSAIPAEGLAPEKFSHYIGLNYPPLPEGLTEGFAMLIQDAEDHSLTLLTEGSDEMLWLSKMTHRDSDGNAFWEVEDILDLSDQESGMVLLPDGCSLDGTPDSEILVVGRDEVIVQAWRANTALDVFEVIPTDGVECHSDKAVSLH